MKPLKQKRIEALARRKKDYERHTNEANLHSYQMTVAKTERDAQIFANRFNIARSKKSRAHADITALEAKLVNA